MPRNYVKKKLALPTSSEAILDAIRAVKIEKKATNSVAKMYNIPKSNLYRYIEKLNENFPDDITPTDEQLIEFVNSFSSTGMKTVCFRKIDNFMPSISSKKIL